jgi:outer membrane receptor protein involved in Fe transport
MSRRLVARLVCLTLTPSFAPLCHAGGLPATELPTMQVVATVSGEEVDATAASAGVVDSAQIAERPISRPAEVLEVVPGLIATQHSGDGKANQYFLRGFNLDHGTDLAASVDGVPNNLRSHGHGQGYNDLNGLIPELIDTLSYRKGPYSVADGDFSSAGSVAIRYKDRLDGDFVQLTGGEHGYARGLVAASGAIDAGNWLAAADLGRYDGPWKKPEDERRLSVLARVSGERDGAHGWLEALAYHNRWEATDQIPKRAVDDGLISRLGQVDPDLGGDTSRATLTGGLRLPFAGGVLAAQAYAVRYHLTLTSDFTYFLDDPVNGDQFQQVDRRWVYGGALDYHRSFEVGDTRHRLHVGVDLRDDDIGTVGLYHTAARERLSTVRQDSVDEASLGSFVGVGSRWTDGLRSEVGARYDLYHARVDSNIADNSGRSTDHQSSPKASLVLGPWHDSELFLNVGRGFHSNDARGATLTVDPTDPAAPAAAQALLVPTLGSEIGMRTRATDDLTLSASLWRLRIGSELVFSGDGGTTEASYPSLRSGLELSAYYRPNDWLLLDADFAQSHASFRNNPAGHRVPNAVERAASVGVEVTGLGPWSGGLRYRYLGPAPLIEDNSARSGSTTLVNAELGYRWSERVQLRLEVLNLLDSRRNDITYFYASQLSGEASPVADTHFHPVEPRQLRLGIRIGG